MKSWKRKWKEILKDEYVVKNYKRKSEKETENINQLKHLSFCTNNKRSGSKH
jgi:hypothetical protein